MHTQTQGETPESVIHLVGGGRTGMSNTLLSHPTADRYNSKFPTLVIIHSHHTLQHTSLFSLCTVISNPHAVLNIVDKKLLCIVKNYETNLVSKYINETYAKYICL